MANDIKVLMLKNRLFTNTDSVRLPINLVHVSMRHFRDHERKEILSVCIDMVEMPNNRVKDCAIL